MKKLFSREFIIGLSVILTLVILYFGIEYLKGINLFKPANFYIATYHNVAGLEMAAPVTIDGYKVGQVRDIKFNYENPGKIEVTLALNKDLRIPEDSKAMIGSGLLDGAYVEIKLGKSSKMVEVGGQIATDVLPDMMSTLSDNLMPSVQNILPKVDSLLLNLNRLVADPALTASIKSLDVITTNLASTTGNLDRLMAKDMPYMVKNASHAASNIDSITSNLIALSEQLKSIPVASTVENVNELTGNLAKFSDKLNSPNSNVGKFMNDTELYDRINRLSADVDSLILDIQRNPKRYISIKLL